MRSIDKKHVTGVQQLSILTPFKMSSTPPPVDKTAETLDPVQFPSADLASFFAEFDQAPERVQRNERIFVPAQAAIATLGLEAHDSKIVFEGAGAPLIETFITIGGGADYKTELKQLFPGCWLARSERPDDSCYWLRIPLNRPKTLEVAQVPIALLEQLNYYEHNRVPTEEESISYDMNKGRVAAIIQSELEKAGIKAEWVILHTSTSWIACGEAPQGTQDLLRNLIPFVQIAESSDSANYTFRISIEQPSSISGYAEGFGERMRL